MLGSFYTSILHNVVSSHTTSLSSRLMFMYVNDQPSTDNEHTRFSDIMNETTSDVLEAMLKREREMWYRRSHSFHQTGNRGLKQDRRTLIGFCFNLCSSLDLDQETVQKAMDLSDRHAASSGLHRTYDRTRYQLLVLTCLYISIKKGTSADLLSVEDLSEITSNVYTCEEIEAEEKRILQNLERHTEDPTASHIARHVLSLVYGSAHNEDEESQLAEFMDRVNLQINISILDIGLSKHRPSTIALAALLGVMMEEGWNTPDRSDFRSLMSIMNRYDFESPGLIEGARSELRRLMDGVEVDEDEAQFKCDMSMQPEASVASAPCHECDRGNNQQCSSEVYENKGESPTPNYRERRLALISSWMTLSSIPEEEEEDEDDDEGVRPPELIESDVSEASISDLSCDLLSIHIEDY